MREFFQLVYQFIVTLGGPGLFFLALADSSFVSIPEGNDLLIIILSTGQGWSTMAYYVAMTTAGSVVGCSMLYLVGRRGGGLVERRTNPARLARVRRLYKKYGVWSILVPSLLPPPTPFKIFVLSAGLFGVSYPRFAAAVCVGRTLRYLFWGVLAVLYGQWAKELLEDHFKTVGLVLAGVFLILVVGYLFFRMRAKRKNPQEEAA